MFIVGHRFRYSLLYSVLGFFITTLLKPYSESKDPTRWGLSMTRGKYNVSSGDDASAYKERISFWLLWDSDIGDDYDDNKEDDERNDKDAI